MNKKFLSLAIALCVSASLQAQPDTIEEYVILEKNAYEFVCANPTSLSAYREYAKIVRQSYKQTWAEKNPAQYALLQTGIAVAGAATTAYIAHQAAQPAQPVINNNVVVQQPEDAEQPGSRRANRRNDNRRNEWPEEA